MRVVETLVVYDHLSGELVDIVDFPSEIATEYIEELSDTEDEESDPGYTCRLYRIKLTENWEDLTLHEQESFVCENGRELCLGDYV